MKRIKNLYQQICEFENIERAYYLARRGKRYRAEVLRYTINKQMNILKLRREFMEERYRQGPYKAFYVREPKLRLISALPFYDRVAQHAINNVLEPILDNKFYFHSYACRKNKGMHKASEQLGKWIYEQTYPGRPLYAIKGDIHHFFASIDHEILKRLLRRTFADAPLLRLLDRIIDSGGENGRGVPVGNLTSQLFANFYLNELDKFVKEQLHAKFYIRYMDDFVILSHDKAELDGYLTEIEKFINNKLRLDFNPKTCVLNCKNNVNFVGYRTWADHKKLRKSSVRNMRLKIRLFRHGKISKVRLLKAYTSWDGHASHADAWALRRKIQEEVIEAINQAETG